MERIAGDVDGCHLGVLDLAALHVGALIKGALDGEARLGRGRRDQLDDGDAADQRPPAPVLGDVAEQAVFDLVPFRGAGRIVVDVKGEGGLVGELLQLSAVRSGCLEPSSALRFDCREKPSLTSSLRTVSALIGWPMSVSVAL